MTTYVQFKDGIAHAHVTTDGVMDDPSFVEVTCSGHMHLGQSWNGSEWVDAKPIRYAILDEHDTVVQINTTLYPSEVQGKILENNAIQVNWVFDGASFNPPVNDLDKIKIANTEKEEDMMAGLAHGVHSLNALNTRTQQPSLEEPSQSLPIENVETPTT
jgi:hypothetical protein